MLSEEDFGWEQAWMIHPAELRRPRDLLQCAVEGHLRSLWTCGDRVDRSR